LSIEAVTLPSHHQDLPGDPPKCKGFALVTLSNTLDVEHLINKWPWEREPGPENSLDGDFTDIQVEAKKYGFRVLPKWRWESLQKEYIAYRRSLLDDIAAFEDAHSHQTQTETHAVRHSKSGSLPSHTIWQESPPETVKTPEIRVLDLSPSYPANCLVFARNIHPETNKTTLRTLFSTAFKGTDLSDGLDYVDFNKGLDSVRFPSSDFYFIILMAEFKTSVTFA
jgi:hypothetical protein